MPNDLILRVGLDDSSIKRQIATLNKTLNSQFSKLGSRLESIGKDLTLRVTAPIAAVGVASVRTFAQFDKLEKGLAAISGSTAEAQRQFGSMLDIVKDTRTTLDLRTAATAALQLQAVGRSAQSVENTLRQLGIAATLAGSSADDVGEVGRQLSQAAAKGKILQQELRIILERIPSLAAVIKNEFGTVTAEGLREAGVSADEFITRLTRAIETNEKFQNVQGGISKAIETFGINLQIAGAELGKTISETIGLENALNSVSSTIANLVTGFSNLSPTTKTLILGVGGLAAAIGPLSLGIGALIRVLPLLQAGLTALISPVGLLGIGLGILAAAFLLEASRASAAEVAQNRVNKVLKEATTLVNAEKDAINKLVSVIESENSSKGDKARAIEQLKRINPEYFGQLDVEKSKTKDLTQAVDAYTESLKRVTIEKLNQDSLEAQRRLEAVNKELEVANFNLKDTAGQIGGFGASGGRVVIARLEREREELQATIDALAVATQEAVNDAIKPLTNNQGSAVVTTTQSIETQVSQPQIAPLEGIGQNATNLQALIQEVDRNINLMNQSIEATGNIAQNSFAGLVSDDIAAFKENIETVTSSITEYAAKTELLETRNNLLGGSLDVLKEKLELAKEGFENSFLEGTAAEVEFFTEKVKELNSELERQQRIQDTTAKAAQAAGSAFSAAADSQVVSMKSLANAAKSAARDFIKAEIQKAIISGASTTIQQLGFLGIPLAIAGAAAAGAALNALLSSVGIPALADGGITTGPTLALIGEGREQEAVLPLSKLNNLIDNSQPSEQLIATVGIDQLYIALERYKRENGRVN